ncbi:phage tail spike protein [Niallia sp. FSL W8-0954]|uniref:phage tail spike protein n=1 Tax=Niallia sp. FSL W8-0954 TaxID=2975338 RepID=UPI0030FC7D31
MYKVTIINDGKETVIHSPVVNELKLPSGIIKKAINAIDSFIFSFHLNNPGYGKMKPLRTLVNVLNIKTGKYEFEGRVLGPSEQMDPNGLIITFYECEGELAYLHDSQQRHLEFRGTPKQLLQSIISYHNQQVEEYKRFEVGEVTVTNSTNNLYLYLSAEKDTYDTIKEKLIDNVGGELQVRKENGVRYLDWLVKIGVDSNTEIKIAKNLLTMTRDVDPSTIITRLTPLGTRIESKEEGATDASEARLTIESVNGGKPYIDNPALVAEFGIQGGSVIWDDVTIASNLLSKGKEWFANQKTSLNQYQISAIDLSLIGLDIDSFVVGNTHPVINPIMAIDERLRIVGNSIDINEVENSSLTIGDKFKTLYQYQSEANKAQSKVAELQNAVSQQTNRIGSISTELSLTKEELNSTKEMLQQTQERLESYENITDEDITSINRSVSDLLDAINDIEQAIADIPQYQLATSTTDGLMSASDKSKLDLIKLLNSIDLDVLKDKLDLITVSSPVNLDTLVERVTKLEEGGQ